MRRRFLIGLAALVGLALVRYGWAIHISFINDDFLFLERARRASFLDNWGFDDALGNVYRPLTRNLYFWLGLRLLGRDPAPYHVANLVLVAASLVLTALVARRLIAAAGRAPDAGEAARGGLLAALLFGLHPAAGTPASWVCGVQDLLAVDLVLGALLAHLAGRRFLYTALYAAAVLSKETAALLFPLVALWDGMVARAGWRRAVVRQAGAAALFAVWLAGNRWLPWNDLGSTIHSRAPGHPSLLGRFDLETVWITVRSLFLLQPAEAFRWPYGPLATAAQLVLGGVVLVLALAGPALAGPPGRPRSRRGLAGLLLVAVLWSLSGILPLVTVISHFVYYAYYPALGLSILAAALATRLLGGGIAARQAARALLVALARARGAGAGLAYHASLCDAHNIRRASAHLLNFRADLLRLRPALPESARVYFWNIPYWIGFQLADGPALRVWYGDPTLTGHFLSAYAPSSSRPTFFFGHDDSAHLVEIVRGLPDPQLDHPPPIYALAHNDLGSTLAAAGEPEAALVEWDKVLRVDAGFTSAAANLGMTLNRLGRFAQAVPALAEAARLEPGATDVRLELGQAYLSLGRYPEALAALEDYLRLAPEGAQRVKVEGAVSQLRADLARPGPRLTPARTP